MKCWAVAWANGLPGFVVGMVGLAVLSTIAHAQSVPDAGSVMRELERPQRQSPAPAAPALEKPGAAPAPAPASASEADVRFEVRSFALRGVSLLPPDEVQAVLAPWLRREIDFAELEKALDAIAALYQSRGWLARAVLPEQTLDERAEVRIEVIEAVIGETRVVVQPLADQPPDAVPRLPVRRLERLLQAQLPTGSYLRLADYERALSLANDTSGVIAAGSLAASQTPGATDIVLTAQDKGVGAVALVYDNGGSLATGTHRLNAQMSANNPLQLGDQLTLGLMGTEGIEYQRLAYSLPAGYDGWRLGVQAAHMRYQVTGGLSASGASGSTWVNGLNATWPWQRSAQGNTTLSLAGEHKRFRNVVPDLSDGRKTLEGLQLGLSGDRSDLLGNGGATYWSLNLGAGRLAIHTPAEREADQAGPQTEGAFVKLSGSLSRLQRWGSSHALWLSWNGQRASRNLDSSEKFSLGGAQGVRAYPASEATGDHGWLITAEWRYNASAQWQWIAFYDHGRVRVQHSAYAGQGVVGSGPSHVELRGYGAGLAWTAPTGGSVRATVAHRYGRNPLANPDTGADSDGSLRRYRLWLSATLNF